MCLMGWVGVAGGGGKGVCLSTVQTVIDKYVVVSRYLLLKVGILKNPMKIFGLNLPTRSRI